MQLHGDGSVGERKQHAALRLEDKSPAVLRFSQMTD